MERCWGRIDWIDLENVVKRIVFEGFGEGGRGEGGGGGIQKVRPGGKGVGPGERFRESKPMSRNKREVKSPRRLKPLRLGGFRNK